LLTNLHIRNLAVVDEVDLELAGGMTSLTGETGAGKSILVDALGLALGERADSEAVRVGTGRAEVSASFELGASSAVLQWLQEHDLGGDDQECLVRRVVTSEGRSRGYINGNAVPMQILRQLGQQLVDICGQQAHQSLLRPAVQRQVVDQSGGLLELAQAVRTAFHSWREAADEFESLSNAGREREERLDLLRYQIGELEALGPQAGELAQLNEKHTRAANAVQIGEGIGSAIDTLYDSEQSAQALVSRSNAALEALSQYDSGLSEYSKLLNDADIQIGEAVDGLRRHLDSLETNPGGFQELEARLAAFHDQARKHRVEPDALPELLTRLQEELDALDNSGTRLAELEAGVAEKRAALDGLCQQLTQQREATAARLSDAVTANIRKLGMEHGGFEIALQALAEPTADGLERIEFRVGFNPGVQPGNLNKVASGGELSRVSLAIQVAARSSDAVGTLIFDEVDSGVGGAVAEIVGEQLHQLAGDAQVICVTHLPQVASQGDHQLRVSKLSDGKTTRTSIKALTADERIGEIARMLGGTTITDATRAHAEEMLNKAG